MRLPDLGRWSVAIAALIIAIAVFLPIVTVGPLAPGGGEPSRRGSTAGFQAGAGAGLSFAAPDSRLAALGIGYTESMLRPGDDYTPGNLVPRAIVIHNTDSPASQGCAPVASYFRGPVQASTHFCIQADGSVWALVPLDSIAWGNGDISSPNRTIPLINEVVQNGWWMNQYTWSIELALDYTPTTEYLESYPAMIESLTVLLKFLAEQGGFPLNRNTVLTHRDINATGRVDPICCWKPGGLAAGAQAFDAYVTSLSAPSAPASSPPPAAVHAIYVYQIGQALYTFNGGFWTHINNPAALVSLGPYEIVRVSPDDPVLDLPVHYAHVPESMR